VEGVSLMPATDSYQLNDRFLAEAGTVFLTGIQALARLPLEQLRADRRVGLNTAAFVSGYQGSPLGGYGDAVARAAKLQPDLPIVFKPGMNEEYAATAVMGSQLASVQPDCRYDGVVGIWYGKAPGVDRAADALRHAVYAGTSMFGGAIAIVGDDPAAKSSTIPSSSAGLLFDMHMPIFYPGDPVEALTLGRHAIAMSRATGLWVAMKIVADVADATATMDLHPEAFKPIVPLVNGEPYRHEPDGRLLTPHTLELEREMVEVRYELARRYAADNGVNYLTTDPPDAWIGIVASGITYREVREAFARLGLNTEPDIAACGIRLLKMGMPMPFNTSLMREFARGVREVLVIEEKAPNVESLLKDALYDLPVRPMVVGKVDETGAELARAYGSLDADAIVPILRRRLAGTLGARLLPERTERTRIAVSAGSDEIERAPFFCSGCPHNRSTEVPDGTLVGAGIGCHTMTLLMDPDRVGNIAGITCMGNEGTQWIGMAPFVERSHFIQNLGDGTFFHSGLLAIRAAVAAGVNITYKLLYNGTVAMTGGQDPEGKLDVPAVARLLLDGGVAKVLITADDTSRYRAVPLPDGVDVWRRERLIEAQVQLAKVRGVTVLVHDQACAAESRRDRKRGLIATPNERVVINHRICEGCGDCGQVSNCLSVRPVDTFFGRKTTIDQTTCNLDYSCLEGDCPSFVTVTLNDSARVDRVRADHARRVAPPADLGDPVLVVPVDEFALRITGIGGTGVVTVAQVIGTAAMLGGFHVRGLDQIGLSQKAGPVVSDVRLSRVRPTATNRLGEGQADLLLAFDQLVAASDKGLLTASADRTTVVGSTSTTPTGSMITHLDQHYPTESSLRARIAAATRADVQHWADAERITTDLLGSAAASNVFVVGMAVQAGCLPVSAADLERAITLNGVAVDTNIAAFRWGRAQIARPDVVEAARRSAHPSPAKVIPTVSDDVERRVDALELPIDLVRFASELTAWQNEATARRWLAVVERVAVAERRVDPTSTSLSVAVAANLYKLMAYKDEYEVARLMTDADGMAAAHEFRGRVAWRLHPPILRALGLKHKISIPSWATPGVNLLARAKFLRGTPFDIFGWAKVRRVERELPGEYIAAIDGALSTLSAATLPVVIDLAELPDLVRGYEHIKLANVERYRSVLAAKISLASGMAGA
jgi:indolepyruvate ferredoxin oxidoreductase